MSNGLTVLIETGGFYCQHSGIVERAVPNLSPVGINVNTVSELAVSHLTERWLDGPFHTLWESTHWSSFSRLSMLTNPSSVSLIDSSSLNGSFLGCRMRLMLRTLTFSALVLNG